MALIQMNQANLNRQENMTKLHKWPSNQSEISHPQIHSQNEFEGNIVDRPEKSCNGVDEKMKLQRIFLKLHFIWVFKYFKNKIMIHFCEI